MADIAELPGLSQIRSRFLGRLDQKILVLEDLLEILESGALEAASEAAFEAQRALHSIAGSAGTLGFLALGAKAQSAEAEIIAYREQKLTSVSQLKQAIEDFLDEVIKAAAGLQQPSAGVA